jgi:hypothetical protein
LATILPGLRSAGWCMLAPMELAYLLFDFTDEADGRGSFDAMACVLPARLDALLGEIERVLRWAHREFGQASAEGEWDFDLLGTDAADAALAIAYDAGAGKVVLQPPSAGGTTLTLTLAGSRAFCEALRQAFASID